MLQFSIIILKFPLPTPNLKVGCEYGLRRLFAALMLCLLEYVTKCPHMTFDLACCGLRPVSLLSDLLSKINQKAHFSAVRWSLALRLHLCHLQADQFC